MSYNIEDTVRLNNLYDFYQNLLTDKQRQYFMYYFREDYSLSEIAEIMDVSRNAVHLQIKKITSYLESYEEKLKLFKKQETRQNIIDDIINHDDVSNKIKDKIKKIEKV
ncbi:DNA-binding protein [Mycoplasmatota bacterium]|nr:DNA-binding protein [Mycoplasmatota bacterium]